MTDKIRAFTMALAIGFLTGSYLQSGEAGGIVFLLVLWSDIAIERLAPTNKR